MFPNYFQTYVAFIIMGEGKLNQPYIGFLLQDCNHASKVLSVQVGSPQPSQQCVQIIRLSLQINCLYE